MNRAELKELSKSQLKGHWKIPVLTMLAYCLVTIIISTIQEHTYSGIGVFLCFIILLGFDVWAFVGFPNLYLSFVEKDGDATYKDLLVSKGVLLKSLGYIVLMLVIGVIIGIIVGLATVSSMTYVLFSNGHFGAVSWSLIIITIIIAVGLTIFSLAIAMTGYIIVDKQNVGVFEAIGLSMKMMKGYKWELFVIYLSFIGWGILSILTLGIGYLWLAPYMTLTVTNFYKQLDNNYNNPKEYSEY